MDRIGNALARIANARSRSLPPAAKTRGDETPEPTETLYDRVARMKHRWLSRVMYDARASSSEKCFAYLVMDHLNCVTLDCWPGKRRIIERLGWNSARTADRVAKGLEALGLLRITRPGLARYAPVFVPEDADKNVTAERQICPPAPDKFDDESLLLIHSNKSAPTEVERNRFERLVGFRGQYDRRQRGEHEREVARLIGPDGYDVLSALSGVDDTIVDRLCAAYAEGVFGLREIEAARLAVGQLKIKQGVR